MKENRTFPGDDPHDSVSMLVQSKAPKGTFSFYILHKADPHGAIAMQVSRVIYNPSYLLLYVKKALITVKLQKDIAVTTQHQPPTR